MRFKNGQKVRMVWKSIFCGGSNQGVIVNVERPTKKLLVRMKNGDHVIHSLAESDLCEVVREEDFPAYCVALGREYRLLKAKLD